MFSAISRYTFHSKPSFRAMRFGAGQVAEGGGQRDLFELLPGQSQADALGIGIRAVLRDVNINVHVKIGLQTSYVGKP